MFLQDAAVLLCLLVVPLLGVLGEHSAPADVKGQVGKRTHALIDPTLDHDHDINNVELELQQ